MVFTRDPDYFNEDYAPGGVNPSRHAEDKSVTTEGTTEAKSEGPRSGTEAKSEGPQSGTEEKSEGPQSGTDEGPQLGTDQKDESPEANEQRSPGSATPSEPVLPGPLAVGLNPQLPSIPDLSAATSPRYVLS